MFEVDYDLRCLTVDELLQARERLHQDGEEIGARDAQLAELFAALEHAVLTRRALPFTADEKHVVAEALGIDEDTGEWDAGA